MKTYSDSNLTEKVSVNINISTLAAMDMLVDNGYYSNRSDFINQALREALQRNQSSIERCAQVAGKRLTAGAWFMGIRNLSLVEVEEILAEGRTVSITGYGLLRIEKGIPPEQLFQAVREIRVKGRVMCSVEEKEHYGLS